MIHDVIDRVCHRCWTTPRRLELIECGPHCLWLVRCNCTTAVMLIVSDGSPLRFEAKRAA